MKSTLSPTSMTSSQSLSRKDVARNLLLSVSFRKLLLSAMTSGRSRSYHFTLPLSVRSNVVSSPHPIFTMVPSGYCARKSRTTRS